MKLGEVIETSTSDQKPCKQFDKQCKQSQAIHCDGDIAWHVTHSHNNQSTHQSNHSTQCSKQCTCTCSSCKTTITLSGNTFKYLRKWKVHVEKRKKDCCMLSLLLAVPSCIYSFWHGVIPTSYFTCIQRGYR